MKDPKAHAPPLGTVAEDVERRYAEQFPDHDAESYLVEPSAVVAVDRRDRTAATDSERS